MAYIDVQEVKRHVTIEKAAELLGLMLKKEGSQLRMPCPACSGEARTLALTPQRNLFYCFAAKKGGDCVELVQHITGLDFQEALQFLSPAPLARESYSSPIPPAKDNSAQRDTPAKREPFDPASFADKLAYDDQVAALGLSEPVAREHRIGTRRGKLYIPLCPPDVTPVGYVEVHEGKLKLPDKWLSPNVVQMRRPA